MTRKGDPVLTVFMQRLGATNIEQEAQRRKDIILAETPHGMLKITLEFDERAALTRRRMNRALAELGSPPENNEPCAFHLASDAQWIAKGSPHHRLGILSAREGQLLGTEQLERFLSWFVELATASSESALRMLYELGDREPERLDRLERFLRPLKKYPWITPLSYSLLFTVTVITTAFIGNTTLLYILLGFIPFTTIGWVLLTRLLNRWIESNEEQLPTKRHLGAPELEERAAGLTTVLDAFFSDIEEQLGWRTDDGALVQRLRGRSSRTAAKLFLSTFISKHPSLPERWTTASLKGPGTERSKPSMSRNDVPGVSQHLWIFDEEDEVQQLREWLEDRAPRLGSVNGPYR